MEKSLDELYNIDHALQVWQENWPLTQRFPSLSISRFASFQITDRYQPMDAIEFFVTLSVRKHPVGSILLYLFEPPNLTIRRLRRIL